MFPRNRRFVSLIGLAVVLFAQTATAQITAFLNFPPDDSGSIPAQLSATGAFTNVADLSVIPGLYAYGVNQPLWSDGAKKFRWFGLPAGAKIQFSKSGKWVFPEGSVLVKHFELGAEGRRVETRFEIIKAGGGAYFLTYRWRADHSDADLVSDAGFSENLTLADGSKQFWDYPSRINCTACHNDSANPVLGPNTRQLNRSADGSVSNQLALWNDLGLFAPAIDPAEIPSFDKLVAITDEGEPLEKRVRSYLDTNCAVCHNPASSPPGAIFDARFTTPLDEAGIINGGVRVPLGGAAAKVIKAQDPSASVLFHRLTSDDVEIRMPPLGRDVVDEEARDVILRWLLSLDPIESLDIAGYVSRWRFEDSLDDETGANDGSMQNAASYEDGVDGRAVALSGGGEHIDLGVFDFGGSQMTLSLWIWAAELSGDVAYLASSSGPGEQDVDWSIGQTASGSLTFLLKTDGVTTTVESPPGILGVGEWVHVGAIYNGTSMRLYSNGSQVGSASKTGEIDSTPGATAAIGWQPGAAAGISFSGRIDDLRVYGRGLIPSDLEKVRQVALNDNEAPDVVIEDPDLPIFALAGDRVDFVGSALDSEDGELSAGGIWYSSRDGELNSGDEYSSTKLTIGEHLMVFTANDTENVASSASVPVTIVPGFSRYIKGFGLSGAAAGALADSDGDGIVQLQEYAFYLDPTQPQQIPVRPSAGGIQFPVSKRAIDLEYVVQFSSDLTSWVDGTIYRPGSFGLERTDSGNMEQLSEVDLGDTFEITERPIDPAQPYQRILVRQL